MNAGLTNEKEDTVSRVKSFLENEARSCSMVLGYISPLDVYRMCGRTVLLEDNEDGLKEIKNGCDKKILDELTAKAKEDPKLRCNGAKEKPDRSQALHQ